MTPAIIRITDVASGLSVTIAMTRARAEMVADNLLGRFWPDYLIEIDPPETEQPA